ncbi:MAG: trypsin-like peptidase domain-containing protein [Thermoleophilia bacterium]|nr:trypsin-like peptidase domain-containing protein [Thermoleophilia bacterium]
MPNDDPSFPNSCSASPRGAGSSLIPAPCRRGGFCWSPVLLLLVVAALVLAGCGSGSDSDSASDSGKQSSAKSAEPVILSSDGTEFSPSRIYKEAVPGVVSVRSIFTGKSAGPFGPQAAGGSGFVLNDDGEIVTNAHVISNGEGDDRVPASQVYAEFTDGNVLPAKVVGFDPFADVGLLQVDPADADLDPVGLADSDQVVVGQPIAVIGSPFGQNQSLSTGIVSQTGRSVMSLTDFQIEGAIQTDASINPGNSGGPMLDGNGDVIGISQQMSSGSGSSDGVGFGVPVNSIKRSVEQLRENGEARYAYIGVSTQPLYPQLAEKLGIDAERGAIVAQVVDGSPAAKAGLRGGDEKIRFQGSQFDTGGDVIVSADGEKIDRAEDLGRIVSTLEPGKTIRLEVIRDGKTETVEVELDDRPTSIR